MMNSKTTQGLKTYKEGAGASRPRPLCVCLHAEVFYYSSFLFFLSVNVLGSFIVPPLPDSRSILMAREFWRFFPARGFSTFFPGARILELFSRRANFEGFFLAREFWSFFSIFQEDINRAADSTRFQISKNAASSWSSFVCSLSVAPFRDVPRF